jgi:phosphatidate cytidylyltransferase
MLADWLIISVIVVVFSTYGDLFESLFKRSINAKDSGTILPGHGGVLDRFDGVMMAAPFVFVYLTLFF